MNYKMDAASWHMHYEDSGGLVQDCSNSIASTLELLQSCTKPSIYRSSNSEVVPLLVLWSLTNDHHRFDIKEVGHYALAIEYTAIHWVINKKRM